MKDVLFVFIVILLVMALTWRFFSRRWKLPCPAYLSWLVERDNPFARASWSSVIVEHLDIEPGMRVLDAGCGPGRVTLPVAYAVGAAGEVVAMDMQQKMLDLVLEKAKARDVHTIRLLHAKLGDGLLKNQYYDRALLVSVLGEIPDREGALKEIFDSLKPGGILSLTEVIFDPHFQTQSKVRRLTCGVGFQLKEVIGNRFAYTMLLKKP